MSISRLIGPSVRRLALRVRYRAKRNKVEPRRLSYGGRLCSKELMKLLTGRGSVVVRQQSKRAALRKRAADAASA